MEKEIGCYETMWWWSVVYPQRLHIRQFLTENGPIFKQDIFKM